MTIAVAARPVGTTLKTAEDVEKMRVAGRLAQWKLDAIAKTGCTVVAWDNPGCLMHIEAAAKQRHIDLRVAHVLELVAEHLA